jgi:hypothetical protein
MSWRLPSVIPSVARNLALVLHCVPEGRTQSEIPGYARDDILPPAVGVESGV